MKTTNEEEPEIHDPFVRLNKFLASTGISSRRKADELIEQGLVEVNGRVVEELGMKIDPDKDSIYVNGQQVVNLDRPVYLVLNKPKDCITTASDEKGRMTVIDLVKVRERVFPIGRLDRTTTGVLLLTNDGDFANRLMHPKYEVKKAYRVKLDKAITNGDVEQLKRGIRLSDGKTEPAEVHFFGKSGHEEVGIVIHEGRNKQIHRMFEALNYFVKRLDRVAYAEITYEGLSRGQWRHLTKGEVRRLMETAGMEERMKER